MSKQFNEEFEPRQGGAAQQNAAELGKQEAVARLREMSIEQIDFHFHSIVAAIGDKVKTGDLPSTKLLVDLATLAYAGKATAEHYDSLARLLFSEMQAQRQPESPQPDTSQLGALRPDM